MSRLLCQLSYTAWRALPEEYPAVRSSPLTESNRRPSPYHGDALPTELRGRARRLVASHLAARLGKSTQHRALAEIGFGVARDNLAAALRRAASADRAQAADLA